MKPLMPMREALADPNVFGKILAGDSWTTWRVLLIAAMGEPLTDAERAVFSEVTGRHHEPGELVDELWALVGRRGGKTRAIAVLGAYIASLNDWRHVLAPGERGSLPIMSATTAQAAKAFSYLVGIFEGSTLLRPLIERQTAEVIGLSNRIDIEIRPASFRTIRGGTAVAAIGDEAAFWSSDVTVNPDAEVLAAVRPALATTGGPLIMITSPYAKRGSAWDAFRRDYGPNGDPRILVAKGPSRAFNPSLPQAVVDRAMARDPAAARSEYLAEFRDDIAAFVSRDAIDAAIAPGRRELPPMHQVRYVAFVDPSGGSADAMTLAIAHAEGNQSVLDAVRVVKPPFSPDAVAKEFSDLLGAYGLSRVTGDRYGGEWPRERFAAHSVTYVPSERSKSEIYSAFLPLLNAGRAELLDLPQLANELAGLERRTARGGRDSIDHAPGAHDDLANAAAGALVLAADTGGFRPEVWIKAFAD